MQIKDPERFKTWLTAVLGPICEADPAALAKYIFALLKRDRPINELQKFLQSQLEEFLNSDTEGFTILLVETLRNESYLIDDSVEIKCEIAVTSSGEKSDTGEKPVIDKPIIRDDEKPRSRSRSLVLSRSPRTKDVKFTRSKRYRRDDHTSDEDEERESYRKYRYHGRSWSPRRSKSPKFKRRFRSPKNRSRSRSQSGSPVKKPKEDIFAEFKKSEGIEKKTLGRCVDFDEKGYCMKGDLCVYDHGKDPVVLATGNGVLSFQNAGSTFTNPLAAPAFPVPIVQNVPVPVPVQPYPPAQNQRMYYPSTEGSYWVRGSGEQKFSKQKRELVSVPTGEIQNRFKRKNFKKEENNSNNNKKPKFDYRRLGPKVSSNEVQLKNVPENLNNISSLNNSFMKFGKITNIQTSSENKEATITFSATNEAQKAYQNIETVFGTLPITANWFSDNSAEVKSVEDKIISPPQKPKTLSLDNRITGQTRLINEKEAEVIKSSLLKKQEEAKKLAQDFSAAITKRKQELLDKQLEQLNKLIEAAPNVKGEQKQILMATIIQLKTNIENIQADLASTVKRPIIIPQSNVKVSNSLPPKTPTKEDKLLEAKQEALKNLLLTDLDLFIKQQQGYSDEKEILDLKKNVIILRNKLKGLGITPASGAAKTAYQMKEKLTIANKLLEAKNKVRETKTTSISVDHRPTQLLVSGYEVDDEDQVITHFLQFGNIIEYISDTIIPALVIKYEVRKDAETAQIKGKLFQDRRLSVTWYNSQHDFVDTSNIKAGPCMGIQLEDNLPTKHFDDKE